MDIVVCVKRVPMTQEVDIAIAPSGKGIRDQGLAWVLNDWDSYAVEQAILLKERFGGSVLAVTVGNEEDEEVLRRALAMGADKALRIDPGDAPLDGYVLARALARAIGRGPMDLVLTGVQADDDNAGMVGGLLAELMGLPQASVVTYMEVEGKEALVRIELEGGMDEVRRLPLPALLTIQTGINEPRYVSVMGIKKAGKKELKVLGLGDLGLPQEALVPGSWVEALSLPPETGGAKILEGDPTAIAEQLLRILSEKGVNV